MAEVIQLESFKRKQAAMRGFKTWSKRFGENLDEKTRLSDLSDRTLAFLISPGDQNIFALYELVMGVKNLGSASQFFHLDKLTKMEVIEIAIHLLDQLRFECMRRLNWLARETGQPPPIVELIEQYPGLGKQRRLSVPALSSSHPTYKTYQKLSAFDKEAFVRKQIPAAIHAFKKRAGE
ncbi:MAG: hypothetical protein ACLFVT_06820 [Syntrophobacteria bacterium]